MVGVGAPPAAGVRPELVLEELQILRDFALETARESMARARGFAMQSEILVYEAHNIAGMLAVTRCVCMLATVTPASLFSLGFTSPVFLLARC